MPDHLQPARADCNAVRAMTQDRAALCGALTLFQAEGDFFAGQWRIEVAPNDRQ